MIYLLRKVNIKYVALLALFSIYMIYLFNFEPERKNTYDIKKTYQNIGGTYYIKGSDVKLVKISENHFKIKKDD